MQHNVSFFSVFGLPKLYQMGVLQILLLVFYVLVLVLYLNFGETSYYMPFFHSLSIVLSLPLPPSPPVSRSFKGRPRW